MAEGDRDAPAAEVSDAPAPADAVLEADAVAGGDADAGPLLCGVDDG